MLLGLSTTAWWTLGFVVGGVIVVVVVTLLLTIIALGRRVVTQAGAIVEALDGTRANTTALFDVTCTNLAIDRITRDLSAVRESMERA